MPQGTAVRGAVGGLCVLACAVAATAAAAAHQYVPSVAALLQRPAHRWPGELLWVRGGTPNLGASARIALGDVTGDGVDDLLVASAWGEVVYFPGIGPAHYGRPHVLLCLPPGMRHPSCQDLAWRAVGGRTGELLLLLSGHLFRYRAAAGRLTGPAEVTYGAEPLAEALAARGGRTVVDIAAVGDWLVLCDEAGGLWQARFDGAELRGLGRLTATDGQPISLDGLASLCAAGAGRHEDRFFALDHRGLWLCQLQGGQSATMALVAARLRDPDGLPVPAGAAMAADVAGLVIVANDGRVARLSIAPNTAARGHWLTAAAPLSVGGCAAPWPCDWDADGREDIVVGGADGRVRLFLGGSEGYAAAGLVRSGDEPVAADCGPCFPALADLDGDGDDDLVLGGRGAVSLWRNEGRFLRADSIVLSRELRVRVAAPMPVDWDGDGDVDLLVGLRPGDTGTYSRAHPPAMLYLENEAGAGRWPRFIKAVAVDVMVSAGQAQGEGAYLMPYQAVLPRRLSVGAAGWLLSTIGLIRCRLATIGPAYPRFMVRRQDTAASGASGDVWAVARCSAGLLCGLKHYGFVCRFVGDQR